MAATDNLSSLQFSGYPGLGDTPVNDPEPWDGPDGSTGTPGGTSGGITGLGIVPYDGIGDW
jgi:hypothetical protein